jgi:hypothetical protein
MRPLFYSGGITSSFHIAVKSFSSYLVVVSMSAFMTSPVIPSILPLFPFFSFFIALIISSFCIGPMSISTAAPPSSISSGYEGCGQLSTS